MKKTWILMFPLFAAALSFGAENPNDQLIRRRVLEKEPTHAVEFRYQKPESMAEPFGSGIEQTPRVVESISAMLDKPPESAQKISVITENLPTKKSHIYLRLNVMEPNMGHGRGILPGFGLGYRRSVGSSAVDFFVGYNKGRGGAHHQKNEFITLPKISYLYYFTPIQNQSFFLGPALALGRIDKGSSNRFEGLIPGASIGYEISRRVNLLSFFQFDVNIPAIAANLKGQWPGPMAEFAFGAGF